MRQARDRQRESIALSGSNPGKSVANIFRHRSSSKRGHELPPLLNDNKVFLIDDTDKAELFSAFFAKHLAAESDPVYFSPFLVAIDETTRSIVIAVRGTLSPEDMIVDMLAEGARVQEEDLGPAAEDFGVENPDFVVHMGILRTARQLRSAILEMRLVEKARRRRPDYPLVVCGHSLGAGVASVLAVLLRSYYPEVKAYAYSPPLGLMNAQLARFCKPFVCSIVYGYDLVSRMSIATLNDLKWRLMDALVNCKIPKYRLLCRSANLLFLRFCLPCCSWPQIGLDTRLLDEEMQRRLLNPLVYQARVSSYTASSELSARREVGGQGTLSAVSSQLTPSSSPPPTSKGLRVDDPVASQNCAPSHIKLLTKYFLSSTIEVSSYSRFRPGPRSLVCWLKDSGPLVLKTAAPGADFCPPYKTRTGNIYTRWSEFSSTSAPTGESSASAPSYEELVSMDGNARFAGVVLHIVETDDCTPVGESNDSLDATSPSPWQPRSPQQRTRSDAYKQLISASDASHSAVVTVLHQQVNKVAAIGFLFAETITDTVSLRHFRHLLDGKEFSLHTGHKSLTYALKVKPDRYSTREVYFSPFLVAIDETTRSIVIAVRGTLSPEDMIVDMLAEGARVQEEDLGPAAEDFGAENPDFVVHMGILRTARQLRSAILEMRLVEKARRRRPDYPLVVCGHSLGAGVASVLAVLLRSYYPEVKAYAYSPPLGLMNAQLARFCKPFVCSIVYGYDLVSRLSIATLNDLKWRLMDALVNCKIPKYRLLCRSANLLFLRFCLPCCSWPQIGLDTRLLDEEMQRRLLNPLVYQARVSPYTASSELSARREVGGQGTLSAVSSQLTPSSSPPPTSKGLRVDDPVTSQNCAPSHMSSYSRFRPGPRSLVCWLKDSGPLVLKTAAPGADFCPPYTTHTGNINTRWSEFSSTSAPTGESSASAPSYEELVSMDGNARFAGVVLHIVETDDCTPVGESNDSLDATSSSPWQPRSPQQRTQRRNPQTPPVAVWSSARQFQTILIHPHMTRDHLPSSLMHALERLHRACLSASPYSRQGSAVSTARFLPNGLSDPAHLVRRIKRTAR
ncbi:hypothetical protein SprV_0501956500 [Sparganum proliferum]